MGEFDPGMVLDYKFPGTLYLDSWVVRALQCGGAMSVQELYENSIKSLPAADRYQLATIILSEIPPQAVGDYRDDWNEEDFRDASQASLAHIARRLESEE